MHIYSIFIKSFNKKGNEDMDLESRTGISEMLFGYGSRKEND
jgi:hypothetical protein